MEIRLEGHEEKNAVQQILQLFFALSDDVETKSRLWRGDGGFEAEAEITYRGKKAKGCAETESEARLDVTNAIKNPSFLLRKSFRTCRRRGEFQPG
ncbi:MAG: hypothetical protein LUG52_04675 [Clostridia bacterium]|nr:hypothetical protein [Clostridia bacterium]